MSAPTAWVTRSGERSAGFAAGMRLGALVALLGAVPSAGRASALGARTHGAERAVRAGRDVRVVFVSVSIAGLLWGAALGAALGRLSAARFDRAAGLVGPGQGSRFCVASWKREGQWRHGVLVHTDGGYAVACEPSVWERLDGAPVLGEVSRGWGAALLGGVQDPLCFGKQIVFVRYASVVCAGAEVSA
ncbi:MAG: hypothetical protein Q8Q09_19150 [Deltaproteobacteria bacterium]|nr:hypothetical protein [Deltaproteobacteria bacterium]